MFSFKNKTTALLCLFVNRKGGVTVRLKICPNQWPKTPLISPILRVRKGGTLTRKTRLCLP